MRGKLISGILILTLLLSISSIEGQAEIAGDDALKNLQWNQVFEEPRNGGVVQSVCATEYYIITMENMADNPKVPDIVSAYYRKDTDEKGNPVTPYTLAKRVQEREWEHCNGMAYNPETGEIYVALYTHTISENRGCLYVMDPSTLDYKRTIKISDDYNILGMDYMKDSDQYMIQTNRDGGYSFKILDRDFHVVEDLGEYAHTAEGENFQDLAVCGDYILNFPLTLGMGIGDFIHMYSISRREMVAAEKLNFQFSGVKSDEPESLCEVAPGMFLAAVNVEVEGMGSMIRFYETLVPYNMTFEPVKSAAAPGGAKVKAPKEKAPQEKAEISAEPADKEGKSIGEILNFSSILETIKAKLSEKDIEIPAKFVLTFVIMTLAFLLIFLCVYAYVLKIRRERKRKERERRRRRRMALETGRA